MGGLLLKRLLPVALLLALTACGVPNQNRPSEGQKEAGRPEAGSTGGPRASDPGKTVPELTSQSLGSLTRDQVRDGLLRLLNEFGKKPDEVLNQLLAGPNSRLDRPDAVPYLKADLDGNGTEEYVVALPVTEPGSSLEGHGAALFVIYKQGNRYEVDRTDALPNRDEMQLMRPYLHAVADLTGTGQPQVIWSRPHLIASGPQPIEVFVTAWKPGAFTDLPGAMAIGPNPDESLQVVVSGKDLLLTGGSRREIATGVRTDRYRFVDGAFRLVDRRFLHTDDDLFFHTKTGESGYGRFWDGLVAEEVGRLADAEADYREVLDPARPPHPGSVWQYNGPPLELTPAEIDSFGMALRTLARYRLGGLLKRAGRSAEAGEVLSLSAGAFDGLLRAMRTAPNREAGCQAGTAWAAADPTFLPALNRGGIRWTPGQLCTHVPIEDSIR